MQARQTEPKGFTLVEILIVVFILGILAALAVPQFSNASETAKASSLGSQLQTIRTQLELFQVQHNGNFPGQNGVPTLVGTAPGGANWLVMTSETDANGVTAVGAPFGPYLQQPPANPFYSGDAATAVNDNTGGGDAYAAAGWAYDSNSGEVKAMLPATIDDQEVGLTNRNDIIYEGS